MEKIELKQANPALFRTNRVNGRIVDGDLELRILEPQLTFPETMKYRGEKTTALEIHEGLISKRGYDFANLGVSGVYTLNISGINYLLAAEQKRELGDTAAKLISGYIDVAATPLTAPHEAAYKELAEEVLPLTEDGRIIRFEKDGVALNTPFDDYFMSAFGDRINITDGAVYNPPGMARNPFFVDGVQLPGKPLHYCQVPSHSMQIVYSNHLELGDIDFKRLGVSLHHSEDAFSGGALRTYLHRAGLLLLELGSNSDLTEKVWNLDNGNFVGVNPEKIFLSEAFASAESGKQGIISKQNISLLDYLRGN